VWPPAGVESADPGQFIEGPLTQEYGLDNVETEKPLLEADDFVEVLQYHWASDINVFPHERQRVQVAAILLLAAFTGSRPHALLNLEYGDLDLYVDRDRKNGRHVLKLGVKLTKTKSRQKRKRP
jgi:integrase